MIQKKKNRINKPITVSLTPEAIEAISILKKEMLDDNTSLIVDSSIKKHLQSYGYLQKLEGAMSNDIQVEIVSEGKSLTKYSHEEGTFVKVPTVGSNYTIRVTNKSGKRKLVVISVDGRSIMDGEVASLESNGYVVRPWQIFDISGWRRTSEEVAAFEFVDIESSYDKQMGGSGSNIGVIGTAVFDEKQPLLAPTHWYKQYTPTITRGFDQPKVTWTNGGATYDTTTICSDSDTEFMPTCSTAGASEDYSLTAMNATVDLTKSIGTGYGEKVAMATVSTTFEKESNTPCQMISLRYATEPTLRKWGVIKESEIPVVNPFPKVSTPAPPGWRG